MPLESLLAHAHRWWVLLWTALVLVAMSLLVAELVGLGPHYLGGLGAAALGVAYAWGLALRAGGRPWVYALLAALIGVLTLVLDSELVRNGAAVLLAVVAGVFAVMSTVPARRFLIAIREAVLAAGIAAAGALAVVGLEPEVDLDRFVYTTLGFGFVLILALVYRLGAGLHGLGRRGVIMVVAGTLILAVTLAYAEVVRRYGSTTVIDSLESLARWSRGTLGAVPRPLQVLLGVPALLWGTHMRARRRQGWWLCAFGVAATVPVANSLMPPRMSLEEAGLTTVYSLLLGLVVGYLVVRIDLALTGPRGSRARRAEQAGALRPEPSRTTPLR